MCGFAGFWQPEGFDLDWARSTTLKMTATLERRGPDGEGVWCDSSTGIAFGHRRLSIQDLSSAGHQPMRSQSGRFMIIFNGEIYNNPYLRKRLEADRNILRWVGTSDTETLLACIETWGIKKR